MAKNASGWSFVILGVGPGSAQYLHPGLLGEIRDADYLLGSQRLLELCATDRSVRVPASADFRELDELMSRSSPGKVCLLVSGDPGLFSGATNLLRRLSGADVKVVPNVSSAQLLFAKLRMAWDDVELLSCHGRVYDGSLVAAKLTAGSKLCLFLDHANKASVIITDLRERCISGRVVVGENLGMERERLVDTTIGEFDFSQDGGLALLYVEPTAKAKDDTGRPRLIAVGVGPGGQEHMTLGAIRAIREAGVIFAPVSSEKRESLSLEIAAPFIRSGAHIVRVLFPMTRRREVLERHWREAADTIAGELREHDSGVFLTLGDASIYSTFAYLMDVLRSAYPEVKIEIVPGVSAALASAAASGQVLIQAGERLAVVSADDRRVDLALALDEFDAVVILKVGSKLDAVKELLEEKGLVECSYLVSRLGQPGEAVRRLYDMSPKDSRLGYMSTIVVKKG